MDHGISHKLSCCHSVIYPRRMYIPVSLHFLFYIHNLHQLELSSSGSASAEQGVDIAWNCLGWLVMVERI